MQFFDFWLFILVKKRLFNDLSFTTIDNTECIADVYTDDTYSSYFDVDDLTSYYCADLVTYPISEATAITAQSRHTAAKSAYKTIADKWRANKAAGGSSTNNPTADCLGIARFVMCANQFRRCDTDRGDGLPVCSFLCTLLKRRCPDETTYYDEICSDTTDNNCSSAGRLSVSVIVSIISFLIYALVF